MITDSGFEVALDVFATNNVFNVPQKSHKTNGRLSAALKFYSGRPLADRQDMVMTELYRRISTYFPTYVVWLVVSNGGKVPDTKITRHYGLWRSLEKNGIELPKGDRTLEYRWEDGSEIQYFGAIRLHDPRFQEVVRSISTHSAVHVVMADSENSVLELLRTGWFYDSRKFPTSMLRYIQQTSMFLLAPLGEFDDIEGGAVALAQPPLIEKCFCHKETGLQQ